MHPCLRLTVSSTLKWHLSPLFPYLGSSMVYNMFFSNLILPEAPRNCDFSLLTTKGNRGPERLNSLPDATSSLPPPFPILGLYSEACLWIPPFGSHSLASHRNQIACSLQSSLTLCPSQLFEKQVELSASNMNKACMFRARRLQLVTVVRLFPSPQKHAQP